LYFQLYPLIFPVLAQLAPSCVVESLTRNNQSKAQSNLSVRASDRCRILNFGLFVVGQHHHTVHSHLRYSVIMEELTLPQFHNLPFNCVCQMCGGLTMTACETLTGSTRSPALYNEHRHPNQTRRCFEKKPTPFGNFLLWQTPTRRLACDPFPIDLTHARQVNRKYGRVDRTQILRRQGDWKRKPCLTWKDEGNPIVVIQKLTTSWTLSGE
jgi:hypothetical protein